MSPQDAPKAEKPKRKKAAPKVEKTDDAALKQAVLAAALKDAAFDGFSDSLLAKAGRAAGADKAALERLFPDGPLSLIEFYSHDADAQMEKVLAGMDLAKRK